jgi:hypothetical protein
MGCLTPQRVLVDTSQTAGPSAIRKERQKKEKKKKRKKKKED